MAREPGCTCPEPEYAYGGPPEARWVVFKNMPTLREIEQCPVHRKNPIPLFDLLSPLEREHVAYEASETLKAVFTAAHEATGWCGDVMDECWRAGLPIMQETMARLMLRTRCAKIIDGNDAKRNALIHDRQ